MSKIIDRTGKGSAISEGENDVNLDSLHGINQVVSGSSHTVAIANQGNTLEFTSATAVAVILDSIATILTAAHTSDFKVTLIATGAGTVTITPNALNTINTGASTIVLTTGEYVTLQTDETELIWNIINSPIIGLTSSLDELNKLDESVDPAEASWTPVIYGSTTAGSPTYTVQSGSYWRIGALVFANIDLRLSAKGGMAGNLRISGLPFTADIKTEIPMMGVDFTGITAGEQIMFNLVTGAAYIDVLRYDAQGGALNSTVDATQALDTLEIHGSFVYLANV